MDPGRFLPRDSHCVLCITCANSVRPAQGDEDDLACLAHANPRLVLFECESYVRKLGRAPDVPARYRQASG
jgi:hypothetical protein